MARIVLIVQPAPAGVSLTWSDGPAAFAPYDVSTKTLATAADAARKALGAVVECYFSADEADAAAATAALATAGYSLYQALFKAPAEQQALATEVRKWLDKLQAEGAVETLEVVAEGEVAVPWNVVYDRRPDPVAFKTGGDDPSRWRPFWGLRYDLSGGRRVSPLRRMPVLENPRVVVVTDPLVIDGFPAELRELAALCAEHGWAQARSRAELTDALRAGRPDVLYWLGHTQTDPFGLVLGDEVITPDDLKTLMEGDPFDAPAEVFGGVAFLNACGTAGKEESGSFLEALHPLGLSGYIATEQATVDTFAAPLGREFLSAFVVRGEPLGPLMRRLRGLVPLGLLYGSYCPSAIHVRRGPAAPSGESAVIVPTRAAVGIKLRRDGTGTATELQPLPAQPYRSLQSYSAEERALFAGRNDDTLRFAQLLDEPATRLVLLHGESGVGKTSFLRAGVIPYLEHECVGYRFARDRSRGGDTVLLVRATNDPVAQIAAALTAYCARTLTFRTPLGGEAVADLPAVLRAAGGGTDRDALRDALRTDPGLLGRLMGELARVLPFTPVLVIDQAEEVFTLARTAADEENRNRALEMLRRAASGPGGFKLVVSLRTEYHGRFTDRLRKGAARPAGVRDYLLTDFGLEELIEVIRRPTSEIPIEHASEVPVAKYGFRFADGVAEEIARRARAYTINRSDSVLPLVQVICTQLYDRVRDRPEKVVTLADLEAIGGVEGGMRAHAEALVARLFPRRGDQEAFKRLLSDPQTQLFIRQSDGTLTTALLPAAFLAGHWSGREPFEEVLRRAGDGNGRLVRVNSLLIGSDEHEQPYVSLGHDALANVAARWQEERQRRKQMRKYAAVAVAVAVVGVAISGALLAYQAQRAKADRIKADSEREALVRREGTRNRCDRLFAEAQQAVSGADPNWKSVEVKLKLALDSAKSELKAPDDAWPLQESAEKLLARAVAEQADAYFRDTERKKLDRLAESHADAAFFGNQATGLGEEENRDRVRDAVADGLALFKLELSGDGPLQVAHTYFTADERRLATHRCYELLLFDAQRLATPIVGEDVGTLRARVRVALSLLDRADRLLPGPQTHGGLIQRADCLTILGLADEAECLREEARATAPVLAADYYLIGLEHYRRDEFTKAIPALAAAIRIELEHYGARYLLAACHLKQKQPGEARSHLDICVKQRPGFAWPRLLRASAEMDLARQNPKEATQHDSNAEADLAHVIANWTGGDAQYVAYTNRGVLAFQRRDWPAAVANLKAAIRLRPQWFPAYINLALTYRDSADDPPWQVHLLGLPAGGSLAVAVAAAEHRRCELDRAANVLGAAIEHQPNVSRLHHERGRIHLLRGDTQQAQLDLVRAIYLAPNFGATSTLVDDLLELGQLLHATGKFAAAVRVYRAVLAIHAEEIPGSKQALAARLMAEPLLALRRWEEAAWALDLYLERTPLPEGTALTAEQSARLASALKARALIYARLKNPRAALDSYTRALGFGRDPEVLILRGLAYLVAGAAGLAEKDFEEALKLRPKDPAEALLGRAEVRLRSGRPSEALADAERALQHLPAALENLSAKVQGQTRLRLLYNAARVFALLALGEPDPDTAVRHVERAAALLRGARGDVPKGEGATFWAEIVRTDPALVKISGHPAVQKVAADFEFDRP